MPVVDCSHWFEKFEVLAADYVRREDTCLKVFVRLLAIRAGPDMD